MRTLKKPVKIAGIGLHSGQPVQMVIQPGDRYGIFFKRTDLKKSDLIPAKFDHVGESNLRNTTVGDLKSAHVQTIEHLMAALFMSGIDTAVIEIDGPETPILDGSARTFYDALSAVDKTAGVTKKIVVKKEVVVKKSEALKQLPFLTRMMVLFHDRMLGRRNNGYVKLVPDDRGLVINATMDYPDKIIGVQNFEFVFDGTQQAVETFLGEISSARTFGRFSEWEYLKSRGMARGASEENVIALNDAGDDTLNPLKWKNEFIRHQIIDIMGDMYTSGGMIVGKVEAYKGGHAMSNMLLKKLFSDPSNYDIIESV